MPTKETHITILHSQKPEARIFVNNIINFLASKSSVLSVSHPIVNVCH